MRKKWLIGLVLIFCFLITLAVSAQDLPAERARSINAGNPGIEHKTGDFKKEFNIELSYYYRATSMDEVIYCNIFIDNCKKNPDITKQIGALLDGVRIKFTSTIKKPEVYQNCIFFPATNDWLSPQKVLEYLKTPLEIPRGWIEDKSEE